MPIEREKRKKPRIIVSAPFGLALLGTFGSIISTYGKNAVGTELATRNPYRGSLEYDSNLGALLAM